MKHIWPLLLLFLFNSCFDQNDCIITSTNLVKIDFKTFGGVTLTKSFMKVQQDSTGTDHLGTTNFEIFETDPLSSLVLPLDPDRNHTHYTLITTDSVEHHLELGYHTYTRVISTNCGAFLYYDNLRVLDDGPDSSRVIFPQLFTSVQTNIKLFF